MIEYKRNIVIPMRLLCTPLQKVDHQGLVRNIIDHSDKKSQPKLSIVIVGYNEDSSLLALIDDLLSCVDVDFEIILVDNGLSSTVSQSLTPKKLLYVKVSENRGCSEGRNIGSTFARGDILVFIDSDGALGENVMELIIKEMRNQKTVALRGKVLGKSINTDESFVPSHYDLGNKKIPSFIDAEGISAWRREPFLMAGGFEPTLAGGEGVVLCYRMCEFYGFERDQFLYVPELVLFHDFAFDESKLKYKIRQREIFSDQRLLRYPFIGEFISYYAKLRVIQSEASPQVDLLTKDIRKEIMNEISNYDSKENKDVEKTNFSVIIPCYNLGEHILDTIESVRTQTLDGVEIIVVDDASPDEQTQRVLDNLGDDVSLIRLTDNGGVSRARNTGIEKARGKYILCLDADDTIMPEYLEKAKNVFDGDDSIDIVTCYAEVWGGREWVWKAKDKLPVVDALMRSPIHTASTFRKSAHDAGGGYDENLRGYEDWDHWLRIIKQGGPVRVIPDILFRYYVRAGSKVNTSNKNAVELVERIVNNHRELYEQYVDKIFAQRHYEWVMRDARLQELESAVALGQTGAVNSENLVQKVTRFKKKFFPRKM